MTAAVTDAHLHVWDLTRRPYPWLTPAAGDLYRSFLPDEAQEALAAAGVADAVLVQAEDSVPETEYLLDLADQHPFVAGVVGWVPLDEPDKAREVLDEYTGRPLCGVRHLVHDDPRDDFLTMPAVLRSLALLVERGLAFDVPDAWPRHLGDVAVVADHHPGLTVVVDHLGKPPRGSQVDLEAWAATLRRVAERPSTVAKVSGLHVPGEPFDAVALRSVWETALETFGTARLMYGSDWPVTPPGGHYADQWHVFCDLASELSPSERDALVRGTAARVYGLGEDAR